MFYWKIVCSAFRRKDIYDGIHRSSQMLQIQEESPTGKLILSYEAFRRNESKHIVLASFILI